MLNVLSFGQVGSSVAVHASRESVIRYEEYSDPEGKCPRTIDTLPIKVTAQKSNLYLGSFYSCMFGQQYDVEATEAGEILNFHRLHPVGDVSDTDKMPLTQDLPTWSREKALAEAKKFAIVVIGKWRGDVGNPSVKFESKRVYGGRYEPGKWHVFWPRVDEHGHSFRVDDLSVIMSESLGGLYVSANFTSKFTEVKFQPKEREEALKLALEAARKAIGKGRPLHVFFDGSAVLNEKPIGDGLFVVRPNKFLIDGSTGVKSDDEARLAWGFSFHLTAQVPNDLGGIVIWIDAENGNCIAGDSF